MSEMQTANLMWRMENMDDQTRRTADRRAGLFAHMFRRAPDGVRRGRSSSRRSRAV